MIINEIFVSLQGEGKYLGHKTQFIRLSGCNKKCSFCDTVYHVNGTQVSEDKLAKIIKEKKCYLITWTGGEPTLQIQNILKVMKKLGKKYKHNMETNGTFIDNQIFSKFNYICFSPKNKNDLKNLLVKIDKKAFDYDIKIVSDLDSIGVDMVNRSTMIMPLTTYNEKKDNLIKQKVWKYCVENNKIYTPRLQVDVYGTKKGV